MKVIVAVIGIILLLVGVGLVAYGVSSPVTSTSSTTATVPSVITPHSTRPIDAGGTWTPGAVVLTNGESVKGSFTISNYSASGGPVFLYIQNISQFIKWGSCAPCASPSVENWTLPSSGTYNFNWTAPYGSSFYMVFDDESYNAVAPAVYSANGTTTTTTAVTTTTPNTTFIDSGAGLIVVGAIVIAVGMIMSTSKKPPPMVPPPSAEKTKTM